MSQAKVIDMCLLSVAIILQYNVGVVLDSATIVHSKVLAMGLLLCPLLSYNRRLIDNIYFFKKKTLINK